jgi:hypothetical protein
MVPAKAESLAFSRFYSFQFEGLWEIYVEEVEALN